MGMDVKPFQQALNDFSEQEIPYQWKRQTIEIVVFLFVTIRNLTPILTGHAYANWRVSIGTPPSGELGTRSEKLMNTTARAVSEQQLRTQLMAMKQGWGRGGYDNFDIVWVFNNVRYIQSLEDGNTVNPALGHMCEQGMADTRDYIRMRGWI